MGGEQKFYKYTNSATEGDGWCIGWRLCECSVRAPLFGHAGFSLEGRAVGRSWARFQPVSYVALLLLLHRILSLLHISLLNSIESTVLGIFSSCT